MDTTGTLHGCSQPTFLDVSDPAGEHFTRQPRGMGTVHAVPDFAPGTLDRCLNVSPSPRSAYLFFTFQLSMMQMQNVEYTFPADTEICTFGFRVTQQWLALNFGTGRARMWNRRYVEFLIKMETLEIPMDPSWPTLLCIRHFQGPYQLVADLNRYFDDPSCRHFRLMHLPLRPQVYQLSYDQPEGWAPLLGATPSTLTRPARL